MVSNWVITFGFMKAKNVTINRELTETEIKAARLLSQGKRANYVARELGMTESSLTTLLMSLRLKLGVSNTVQMCVQLTKSGII